jgi:pimeloyl-ACP methyl ester carboxylesterase
MAVEFKREEEVRIDPPSRWLMLMESRAIAEHARFRAQRRRLLRELPRGDGHPVMIVPGFGASDRSIRPLQHMLERLGYAACGWGQGRNTGMNAKIKDELRIRLETLHREYASRVSLIGWSLGGVFVREMARRQPELVRRVFTLGSPFNGHPSANNVMGLFRLANRGRPVNLDWEGFQKRREAPPVPCTAIYSKTDGVVAWPCSMEESASNTENVEVRGSHFGLGVNVEAIRVIAERLARADRTWWPVSDDSVVN